MDLRPLISELERLLVRQIKVKFKQLEDYTTHICGGRALVRSVF